MSLVRVFSDLHIEFGTGIIKKCVDICASNRTKYTVLAGDITNYTKREQILTHLITELRPYTDHIIYILGNHEYYGSTNIRETKYEYKKLCKKLDIIFLEDDFIKTDDFVFYGTTMWSESTSAAFNRMNDKYSFESRQEMLDMHEESKFLLSRYLLEYSDIKPLVIITHHLPSFSLIDDEYKIYGQFNTGFASNLDSMIKPPVNYWIYGHTHKPNKTTINEVKLFCNPGGYPKEAINFKDCTF